VASDLRLGEGVLADTFISYSSKDLAAAERICRSLEQRGISCWIASRDVRPGDDFQKSVVDAIGAARTLVLVFSSYASESREISKELRLASDLLVIPARIENVLPAGALKYALADRQWIDLFDDWDGGIERLARRVSDGAATVAPPALPSEPKPLRRLNSRRLAVGAGLSLAIIIAIGVWYFYPDRNIETLRIALRKLCAPRSEIDSPGEYSFVLIQVYQETVGHAVTGKLTAQELQALGDARDCTPNESVRNYYELTEMGGNITTAPVIELVNPPWRPIRGSPLLRPRGRCGTGLLKFARGSTRSRP
jgi:TIR domain